MSTGTTTLTKQEREFVNKFVKKGFFSGSNEGKLTEQYLQYLKNVKTLNKTISQAVSTSEKRAKGGGVQLITESSEGVINLRATLVEAEQLKDKGKFEDANKLLNKSIETAGNLLLEATKNVDSVAMNPEQMKGDCERLREEVKRLLTEIMKASGTAEDRDEALEKSGRTAVWNTIEPALKEAEKQYKKKNYFESQGQFKAAFNAATTCWNATAGIKQGVSELVEGVDQSSSGREALFEKEVISTAVPEEKKGAMKKFMAARLKAEDELDKLAQVSAGEYNRLHKVFRTAIDNVNNQKQTLEEGEEDLVKVASDAENARLNQENAIKKEQQKVLKMYQEMENFNSQIQGDKHVPKELKAEYTLRMAAAQQFTTCTNLDGLKGATSVFAELKKSLQATAANIEKCKLLADFLSGNVKKHVESKSLKKVLPTTSEMHGKSFEKLQEDVAKLDPISGLKKAKTFYDTVDKDRTLAKTIETWRDSKAKPGVKYEENRLKERFKELDEHLNKITHGIEKKYDGKLLKDLEDAVTAAGTENINAIADFDKAIAKIDARLNQFLGQDDVGKSLSQPEITKLKTELYGDKADQHTDEEALEYRKQLKDAQFNAELLGDMGETRRDEKLLEARRKEWEKVTWKNWETEFKRVKELVKKSKGDTAELDKIEKLADGANKMAGKKATNQQLDAADSQLALAQKQLLVLEQEPKGAKSTSKAKVGEISTNWNRHVNDLKSRDIPALIAAIKKRVQESEAEDLEAAKKKAEEEGSKVVPTITPMDLSVLDTLLPKAANAFKAGVFDKHVKAIVDSRDEDEPDLNKLKASREQALTQVRQFQAYLNGDPLVKQIVMNPFYGGVFTHIYRSLMDLDLNLQRCL